MCALLVDLFVVKALFVFLNPLQADAVIQILVTAKVTYSLSLVHASPNSASVPTTLTEEDCHEMI